MLFYHLWSRWHKKKARARGRGSTLLDIDVTRPGPCAYKKLTFRMPIPFSANVGLAVPLTVHLPTPCALFGSPPPLLIFYPGYMLGSGDYAGLMAHIASWGVATLQPDITIMRKSRGVMVPGQEVTIAEERALAPRLLAWLREKLADPSSPLCNAIDLGRIAVGGHSRGGKLATLVYCDFPNDIQAACLVDADDSTCAPKLLPESDDNPSAARALAGSNLPICFTAAGIVGPANPAPYTWRLFWPVAAKGSWLTVVAGAAHGQFADSGAVANAAADAVCGKGTVTRDHVMKVTATTILAWCWHRWHCVDVADDEGGESGASAESNGEGSSRRNRSVRAGVTPPSAGTSAPVAAPAAASSADRSSRSSDKSRGGRPGPVTAEPVAAAADAAAAAVAVGDSAEEVSPIQLADPDEELREMPGILAWIHQMEEAGALEFEVKGEGPRPFGGLAPIPPSKIMQGLAKLNPVPLVGAATRRILPGKGSSGKSAGKNSSAKSTTGLGNGSNPDSSSVKGSETGKEVAEEQQQLVAKP